MLKKYCTEIDKQNNTINVDGRCLYRFEDIENICFLPQALIHFADSEFSDNDISAFLCIRGKIPLKKLGKFPITKSHNIYISVSDESVSNIQSFVASHAEVEPKSESFNFDSATAEAKRGMNDYTKAATLGVNAYGRAGIVNPVINLSSNNTGFHISYQGTTSKGHKSAWFSAHPEIDYKISECDFIRHRLNIRRNQITASCDFEKRYIR